MPHHVLIVEDNLILAKSIQRHLEREGVEVTAVGSCEEARRAFDTRRYDLILTDVRLPDGVGLDLIEEIGRAPQRPPVLIITGEERLAWEQRARELGIEAFLVKPFAMATLGQIVRCLLEGHCCFPRCSKGYEPHHCPENCPLNL